jgi:hypothetical protein
MNWEGGGTPGDEGREPGPEGLPRNPVRTCRPARRRGDGDARRCAAAVGPAEPRYPPFIDERMGAETS